MYTSTRIITKEDIDSFGHLNNAVYLEIFEQARWDSLAKNGLNLAKIMEMGVGPVILDIHLKFLHEIKINDHVSIQTQGTYTQGKTFSVQQALYKDDVRCAEGEFIMVFFNLATRKAVLPNAELLQLYGLS